VTFNSITFFVFLGIVVGFYRLATPRLRNPLLLVASYVFYGWWDWRFLSLIVVSTAVDFFVGLRLGSTRIEPRRKLLLITSVVVNLGILGVFKYAEFFTESFGSVLDAMGFESDFAVIHVILPVGISFYTFQTMSYSFDVFRRRLSPTTNLIDFATYVAFFPQLVAGPIERASHLMPQIVNRGRPMATGVQLYRAGELILGGMFRKVVIADGVAAAVDAAFTAPESQSWLALLTGTVAFAVQIYGDFSGYSRIARGVSLLFGVELVTNFAEPYLARNITEFWRRWHISLSDWLRDYLYIPLGGNRGTRAKTYRNLMLTMLLGGLWHGAAWTFVIWGGLHGAYLVVHRLAFGGAVPRERIAARDTPRILATFMAVVIGWVFFRAATPGEAFDVLFRIARFDAGTTDYSATLLVATMVCLTVAIDVANRGLLTSRRVQGPVLVGIRAGLAIATIVVFSGATPTPFIYFQF